jgi:formate dehydrogenase subunit gamma
MKPIAAACAACTLLFAGPALAQPQDEAPTAVQQQQERSVTQPGNNAPVWRQIQSGTPTTASVPGREVEILIQPPARFFGQDVAISAGEAWRQFRNGPITFYGGWLVVAVALAILAFYFTQGPVRLRATPTGRLLQRFSTFERVVHWSTAVSFCALGLTGLAMLFGKHILLPVFGYALFGWVAALSKVVHNFVAPLFIVSVIAMVLVFIRDNLPRRYDLRWFARAWAVMTRGEHVPTGRFNAGEKGWFWFGVTLLGLVLSASGLILDFPNFGQTRETMQISNIVHAAAAVVFTCLALAHIYLGTIGMEGAYDSMRHGTVDEAWAKEHHDLWYRETIARRERTAPGGAPTTAPASAMKEGWTQ